MAPFSKETSTKFEEVSCSFSAVSSGVGCGLVGVCVGAITFKFRTENSKSIVNIRKK